MEDGQSLKPTVRAKKAVSSACSGDMFRKCTDVIYSSAFVSAKSFDNYNRSLHLYHAILFATQCTCNHPV